MTRKRIGLFALAFVLTGHAEAQVIKEVQQIVSGSPEPIKKGTFDTHANLRVVWNRTELNKKLAEFGPKTTISEELKRGAKLAEVARAGLEAVSSFTAQATANPTRAQFAKALSPLIEQLDAALSATEDDPIVSDRLQRVFREAISRGPQGTESAADKSLRIQANQARAAAAVFSELTKIAAETSNQITAKAEATGIDVLIVATTRRDQDSTRRREVPFLSALTDSDRQALSTIQKFATDFGGEPSGLLKAEVDRARAAGKQVILEAKTAVDEEYGKLETDWKKLVDTYGDDSPSKMAFDELVGEVDSLKKSLKAASKNLQKDYDGILSGDPATRADALTRLNEAAAALADAKSIVGGVGALFTQVQSVSSSAKRLEGLVKMDLKAAVMGFETFVQSLDERLKTLDLRLEGIAKGSVASVISALGLGENLVQIAQSVTPADPEKDFVDIDMTKANGQSIELLAGDEVTVGVRMGRSPSIPDAYLDSRRLVAYPDRWTSDRIIPIAFAQRRDRDAAGRRRENWSFIPTYMDVFKRYSTDRSPESNKWLTPGFGIAISALDQNGDDSYEIGIGAGITLFDDRLIGGIGFNTQRNQSYAFFGIRLRLSDLGIRG